MLPSITLNRLKTVKSKDYKNALCIFTNRIVQAPFLAEFQFNCGKYEWGPITKDFLAAVPTVIDITLVLNRTSDAAFFLSAFGEASRLQHLRIRCHPITLGDQLSSLVLPVEPNGPCGFQSLSTLQIDCQDLESIWFQRLAHSRCIPSASGNTDSGCRPLEALKLTFKPRENGGGAALLEQTPEWKSAEVAKSRDQEMNHVYELRWK